MLYPVDTVTTRPTTPFIWGILIKPNTARVSRAGAAATEKQLGHSYLGNWKMGMMHGEGQFNHAEGQVLKPTFVNNLYSLQKDLFVNPFDT